MLYVVFYWIVCGFATLGIPDPYRLSSRYPVSNFILCMGLGGILIPARLINRILT